jgi:hypothetical protein
MVGERNISPPEAKRRRLRSELATARAGVSRNLAVAEGRLRGPLRQVARWRWSVPLLLSAGVGVLVASLGRRRLPGLRQDQGNSRILSLLRTTLAPLLLRAAVRYVESRLLAVGRQGVARPGGDSLREDVRP